MQLLRDNLVSLPPLTFPLSTGRRLVSNTSKTLWTSSEAETSAAGQAEAPKEEAGAAGAPAETSAPPAAAAADEPKAE